MKRYGGLFPKICSIENLMEAHRNAKRDKAYYKEVKAVNKNPEHYASVIRDMLINKTYKVSEYEIKPMKERGKERLLMKLPYFPDRIIQWAILLQTEHTFMEVFTDFTCASITGRGIHRASMFIDRYMEDKKGTAYCLKLDIKKFYPSIDHAVLKGLLIRKIKDKELLELLFLIIDSTPDGKGIPIGSYLSQYLANFYLAYFDHWLKEEKGVKYVVRYMDDIVVFSHSKAELHALRRDMAVYLFRELKLKIKENWQVFPTGVRGVDFIGYRHFFGYKLLRKATCKRFKRKMRAIKDKVAKGLKMTYNEWCSANSYKGWLKWCDGFRLSEKYLAPIQDALTAYYRNNIKKHRKPKIKKESEAHA